MHLHRIGLGTQSIVILLETTDSCLSFLQCPPNNNASAALNPACRIWYKCARGVDGLLTVLERSWIPDCVRAKSVIWGLLVGYFAIAEPQIIRVGLDESVFVQIWHLRPLLAACWNSFLFWRESGWGLNFVSLFHFTSRVWQEFNRKEENSSQYSPNQIRLGKHEFIKCCLLIIDSVVQ